MKEATAVKRRGQRGLGHVYEHRKNWWIAVWIGGKRHRRKIGPVKILEKRDARKLADEKIRELMTAPKPVEQKGTMPFSAFTRKFAAWAPDVKIGWGRYRGKPITATPLKHAVAFFGDMPLREITPERLENFRQHVARRRIAGRPVKNRTVNGEIQALRHVFNVAIKWGDAAANPTANFDYADEGRQKSAGRVFESDEEQNKLIGALPGWMRLLVRFDLQTGARRGDLVKLTWKSVHEDYVEFLETKECKHREVPLSHEARAILEMLRPSPSPNPDAYVFEPGEPSRIALVGRMRRAWEQAIVKAGIPKIRFHDMRHTVGTRLVRGCVDLETVKTILGHASLKTTQRYLHSSDKLKQAAVETLSAGHRLAPAPEAELTEQPVTNTIQ